MWQVSAAWFSYIAEWHSQMPYWSPIPITKWCHCFQLWNEHSLSSCPRNGADPIVTFSRSTFPLTQSRRVWVGTSHCSAALRTLAPFSLTAIYALISWVGLYRLNLLLDFFLWGLKYGKGSLIWFYNFSS